MGWLRMAPKPDFGVACDLIVVSRLLVLQSRRILLASLQRQLEREDSPEIRSRIGRLQRDTEKAQAKYRAVVLAWASPEDPQFWKVAYAAMIDDAEAVMAKLKTRSIELPISDRTLVETDVAQVTDIIRRWRLHLVGSAAGESVPA
jgi:hypothetical protein